MNTATPARPRSLAAGSRLDKYVLLRRIAGGGMAEVYLARADGIDRFRKLFALKLVQPNYADDAEFIRMFLDEGRLAATLDHPNIAQVVDLGHSHGEYFMALEYVHGETVRAALSLGRPLPLACSLAIVASACAGLHYAHELRDPAGRSLGIVHRDVSPSNIMVRYDGTVKVVDFGIAKAVHRSSVTRNGVIKGKARYMSPEQCDGAALDRRSDVFGLGILLAELTTGMPLFVGDNDFAVMNRIFRGEFQRPRSRDPHYPAQLEEIVLRALAPDPDARHPTAQQLQVDLEEFCRRERITLSSVGVAATMHELFGDRPYPDPGEEPEALEPRHARAIVATELLLDNPTATVPTRTYRRRRSAPASLAAALVLGLGGALWLSTSPFADPDEAAKPSVRTEIPIAAPTAREQAQVPEPVAIPEPIPASGSFAADPPAPAVAPAGADVDPAKRRRATRRRSSSGADANPATPKPASSPKHGQDSILPPGM